MKLKITDGAAGPLALLAITTRIIVGVAIDMPDLYCAGWLAALLGGLLFLPAAFAMSQLRAVCRGPVLAHAAKGSFTWIFRLLMLVFAASAAFDGAVILRSVGHSVGYIDMGMTSQALLLAPQLLLCLWSLCRNGDAIGSAARLWNRLLLLLLAIILLLQWNQYRPAWLTPILGSGMESILDGALRIAGWLSLSTGFMLFSESDPDHPGRILHPCRLVIACSAISSLLLLTRNMMTPALVNGDLTNRYFQLDALLSNGRAVLSLQFPMLLAWFIGMLMLLLYDGFVCAAMIQTALPGIKGGFCILLSAALSVVLTLCDADSQRNTQFISRWLYAVQNIVLLLIMLKIFREREVILRA